MRAARLAAQRLRVEASQKSFYTGQCSSAIVPERNENAIFFFSFDLGHTWRPAAYLSNVVGILRLALRSGIRSVIKSHRRAAGPRSQSATKIGKHWPVKSGSERSADA